MTFLFCISEINKILANSQQYNRLPLYIIQSMLSGFNCKINQVTEHFLAFTDEV